MNAQIFNHKTEIVDHCDVSFDSGKAEIDAVDSINIFQLIDTSFNFDGALFMIKAHTDSDGGDEYNFKLSSKRANAVQRFLIRHGIETVNIRSSHFGERLPLADNVSDIGKQVNRRATIVLTHQFIPPKITGIVVDNLTGAPISSAEIILRSKAKKDTLRSNESGNFAINFPPNTVFGLDVSAKQYVEESKMLKTTEQLVGDTLEVRLNKLTKNKKIQLNKLYFVGNKAILLPKSDPEMHKLLDIVRLNEEVCFEIVGHVNFPNQPKAKKNSFEFNLSVARAKAVYGFLTENEIDPSRMFYSGRGNWEMVYPKATSERNMQVNRRVEILIKTCGLVERSENATLDDKSYNFY